MNILPNKDIVIIGAGLIGSLLGVTLKNLGFNVSIYERYSDIRSIPSIGRSINLVLTSRGLRAISMLGNDILKEMLALSIPVYGRVLHLEGNEPLFQPYGKDNTECNYSISRFELNKFLINKAIQAGVKIYFDQKVVSCDFEKGNLTVEHVQEKAPSVIGGDLESEDSSKKTHAGSNKREVIPIKGRLIGADGGGSAIRYALRDAGLVTFQEKFVPYCYKELIFPANTSSSMDPSGLHIWPRKTHFIMALVNKDNSFTGTLYLPNKSEKSGEPSFETLKTKEAVAHYFETFYPQTIPLLGGIDNIAKQLLANPIGSLGFVYTDKFNVAGRVLLIGDACHAIIPFFGQGTNCGFEDVLVLTQLLSQVKRESDFGAAFEQFHILRKPNADAIAQLSFQNMDEMGEKTADPRFLLFKEIENLIENVIPTKFRSQYAMVCYGGGGNISYKNALKLGQFQKKLIDSYINENHITSVNQVDMNKIKELVNEKLVPLHQKLQIDLTTISHSKL